VECESYDYTIKDTGEWRHLMEFEYVEEKNPLLKAEKQNYC
jgi:hypothetical protein